MQAGDDDDESLQPHADVDNQRNREQQGDIGAHRLEPERLRRDDVAEDQQPVGPGIRPEGAVERHVALELIAAVPTHECFDAVAVAHDQAGGEHDLGHVVQMLHGDEVLQLIDRPDWNGQGQHHREAGEERAGDEVRREDGAMPARQDRDGEVEADDRVHRHDQRRGQRSKQEVGGFVAMPVAGRAAPAHGQDAVDHAPHWVRRAVAQSRHVRDEADVPEQQRDAEIGADREDVPHQRAAPLRPKVHRVGVGREPVEELRPAHVQEREYAGAGDGEERHGLGEAVDRGAPLLMQKQQNRRDQRAGVPDADPPDEVDDREAPADGYVDAPDADAFVKHVGDGEMQDHDQGEGHREADPPAARDGIGQHDGADLVRDRGEGMAWSDDRRRAMLRLERLLRLLRHAAHRVDGCPPSAPRPSSRARTGLRFLKADRYVVRGRVLRSASSA